MSIDLTTLGSVRVVAGDQEVADLVRQKLRLALFVYLAVEGETSREGVAGMFWRDRDPNRARHSLSQTLYALRRTVGDGWLDIAGDRMSVSSQVRVDARAFEDLAQRGEAAKALERYSGPFLGTFACGIHEFDHWADRKRAHLDRLHRRLRKEAVDESLASDDLPGALAHARLWVSVDSQDDEAQHRFIQLLAASGERSNALRQYEIYRDALAADGLTPLEDTDSLIQAIRSGAPIGIEAAPEDSAPSGEGRPGASDSPPAGGGATDASSDSRGATRFWGAAEPGGPRLVRLIEGGREGETYPLSDGVTGIGRSQGEIQFANDPLMSGNHAAVRAVRKPGSQDPAFVLRDEGSRNGVFVRIHGDRPLRLGDIFAAGKQVFELEEVDDGSDAESAGPGAATRLGLPSDFL